MQSRRSVARLLGGGALAAAVTGGSLFAADEASGKKRKKKVCLCTATGCTGKKVRNRSKTIKQNPTCNYAGACTTNPCAGTQCTTSAQCTGGQVCTGGLCADCTSYTQCETTSTVGHLACIQGRCRGNETCNDSAECFAPLTCLEPPATSGQPERCILLSDCQSDNDCGNPAAPLCVLGNCVAPCGGSLPACDPRFPCDGGVCLSTT